MNQGPPNPETLKPILARLIAGARLSPADVGAAFGVVMDGQATPAQIGGLLTALRIQGESSAEIAAAAQALRSRMIGVQAAGDLIDVCGTGGDGAGTLNISTAVAFVLAGAGLKVAKHGNRAMSSRSGGADVLAALGLDLEATPALLARALDEAGVAFLFAQAHHPAMRHAANARRELGFRTLFNLIGPLANPAGAQRQLIGVYDRGWLLPMAEALRSLGCEKAWLAHGDGGLDELSPVGESAVASVTSAGVKTFSVAPEDAGLQRWPMEAIIGGEPAVNADALRALLAGAPGAYRDAVLLNAAAGLVIADRAADLRDGAARAAASIDSGAAGLALKKLLTICGAKA